ncbi:Glycerophosphodiester phosphodiesterase, cytoplasmic [bacterium HR40]|nr:Glycerophosphodiester phosphodiesterase, cytoplasmic [bacterium HR40]
MRTRDWQPWRPERGATGFALEIPVIGHRGAAAWAPENTLAGLREAKRRGCRWVEFDVKLTRDRIPVLLHDERLERTTSGRGRARDLDAAEFRQLDAGRWFDSRFAGEPVPTLADAIALLHELDLDANIEIKPCRGREAETAEVVARQVLRLWPAERPVPLFSSFSEEALAVARRIAPEIPRGLLREAPGRNWQDRLVALDCVTLHLDHRRVSLKALRAMREAGVAVLLYTVNDPARAAQLLEAGAAGLFSDVPDLLLAALGRPQ